MERGRHVCRCAECTADPRSKTADDHETLNEVLFHADEKTRRLMAAQKAKELGHGGITKVAQITGLSIRTISRSLRELRERRVVAERIRHVGAGRKKVEKKRPRGRGDAAGVDEG